MAGAASHFLERWETNGALQLLLRNAVTNEAAAHRMREVFGRQVAPRIGALYPDPKAATARAALVSAQILGLALCRYLLKLPAVANMPREELVRQVAPAIQRILDAE